MSRSKLGGLLVTLALLAAALFMPAGTGVPKAHAAPGDVDNDGLPDAWEMQYFGDLDENDIGDPDNDDYTNLAEYNNGTDPSEAETEPPYLATLEWTPVGPGGGGAQYNPVIAPNNPDLMYGFCDMGGIYRSLDGGRNWQMYGFDQLQMPVAYSPVHCNPQFDPFDEDICFAGIQEALKRTTDGGNTWQTVYENVAPTAIAIDRAHTNIVFFADNTNHMYKSTNGGGTWIEITSWYSSVSETVMDMFIDASSATTSLVVYAATSSGLYKTINGGTSWTTANGNLPSTSISDFNAAMKNDLPVLYLAMDGYGIYKSYDNGASWNQRNQGFDVSAAGHMELGICDSNADVLYVGSQENAGPTIYKTTDGAGSWTMVLTDPDAANFPEGVTVERDWMTLGLGWSWGEEPHEIEVCPTDPDYVAFSEDGRTFRSNNGGQHWFCCNSQESSLNSNWWPSKGFETTTNYHVHFAPWDHNRAYITYTDMGFVRSEDRAARWRLAITGSPYRNTFYDCVFDPTIAGKMWALASNNHDLPHEKMLRQSGFLTFSGAVLKSTNYGANWTNLGHPIAANNGAITSIVIDPTSPENSRTLYAAIMGRGVYKSTNDGATWSAANNGLFMPSNMNAWMLRRMSDGTLYCALTEAMNPSRERFPGALFKSTDNAASWTKVNTGQQLPYIYGFDVDPTNQNVIYVATFQMGGNGEQGLWKTANGGTTWTRKIALGDMCGADIDPELHTRVYATLQQGEDWWPFGGMFVSEDSGETWTKMPGLPFERYGPNWVSFDPDNSEIIYVTTFGGGVWKTQVLHAEAPAASFTATPEEGQFPLRVEFDSSASTGNITTYTWDFGDGQRSHAANPTHTFTAEGSYTVTLTLEGMNGRTTAIRVIEAINIDSDGDGLPDWWEIEYFGDLDETADGDPDGDGATNIEEFTNGTDPTQGDAEAPVVSSLATVPTQIRQGVDKQLTFTATADDRATGNSNIVAGEYFVDALGAAGTGLAMEAADDNFDESLEGLTALISTSTWSEGLVTLYVRAKDASGFWSDAESIDVDIVDGTPPSAVSDMAVMPALQFEKISSQAWETSGTVIPQEETLTIDLGELKTVGAVGLVATTRKNLFPSAFTIEASEDSLDWDTLGTAVGYKAGPVGDLWMNAPADYRYVRITATSARNSGDSLYYIKMAEAAVYQTTESNRLRATWRATADDDNLASSGAAAEYDLRYSTSLITPAGFDGATQVTSGVPVPGVKGAAEVAEFSIGATAGEVFVALKVGDEVPNWSGMSNVARTVVDITGLQPTGPDDEISAPPDPVIQFTYVRGSDVRNAWVAFSDRPDFPGKPIKNPNGTTSKTVRYPMKPGYSWWKPSRGQWKQVKTLGNNNGTAYWRLEGKNPAYRYIYGPTRSILFDAGTITDLSVFGSHTVGADEAVWPTRTSPPLFQWTDGTEGTKYFFVDVSTDPTIPLSDSTRTAKLAAAGVPSGPYKATVSEWKNIRKLATKGAGELYWRVRAKDVDKVFVTGSAVRKLVIDGGTWALDPIDLSETNPYVHWTHTGDGILHFVVQFSPDGSFSDPRRRVQMPAGYIVGDAYMMTGAEKARLLDLAARNGATELYWRVRGDDGEKMFVTYSDPETTTVP